MEEDVDDVLDWLESIETLVDVLFLRWSCQDHVRHEMTLFFFKRPLPGHSAAFLHLSLFLIHFRAFSLI